MKSPRDKYKVRVIYTDGSLVTGIVHVPEGLRLYDFLNDTKEDFIVLTDAHFQNVGEVHSFKLISELNRKRGVIFLNKNTIKWVEEIK